MRFCNMYLWEFTLLKMIALFKCWCSRYRIIHMKWSWAVLIPEGSGSLFHVPLAGREPIFWNGQRSESKQPHRCSCLVALKLLLSSQVEVFFYVPHYVSLMHLLKPKITHIRFAKVEHKHLDLSGEPPFPSMEKVLGTAASVIARGSCRARMRNLVVLRKSFTWHFRCVGLSNQLLDDVCARVWNFVLHISMQRLN